MYFEATSSVEVENRKEAFHFQEGFWMSAMNDSALSYTEGDRGVMVVVAGLGRQDVLFGCPAWKSYRAAETHATSPVLFPGHL